MTCENALPFHTCIHIIYINTRSDCTPLSVNFLLPCLTSTHTHTHWKTDQSERFTEERNRKRAQKHTTQRRPRTPHHGPCHKRFLSPGPARLPWVGCQATEAALTCAGERELGIPLARGVNTSKTASVWGDSSVCSVSPTFLAVCLSLLQPSSCPAQLDRNTRSAAGAEEWICWATDRVEQAWASTTSAEVVFLFFFFFFWGGRNIEKMGDQQITSFTAEEYKSLTEEMSL